MNVLRLVEHVHGHLGWLAVAALLHPAILLRDPKRRAPLSVIFATSFVIVTGAMGAWLYPAYRLRLKQALFVESPALGWCFERKEHLAVGALAFAIIGCVAHLSTRYVAEETTRASLARAAHRSFVVAFVLALVVAGLGVAVATSTTF